MTNESHQVLQTLLAGSFVLSIAIVLVLLLRAPVRNLLGSVACYRLWLIALCWLPASALGVKLIDWWQRSHPAWVSAVDGVDQFQLLLDNWVWQPLERLGPDATADPTLGLDIWQAAALLWLTGAIALAAWQISRYRRFSRRLIEQGRPIPGFGGQHALKTLFGNTPPAVTLPGISGVALFGFRNPVLLLPEGFAEHYDADQQHIIFAHEAVHMRRHDNAWNLAASLLLVLGWPNPLFWLAWHRFRLDQELSCDALALQSCSRNQQKRYARTLLDAASTAGGFGAQPALSAWDDLKDLKERTLMITRHLKNQTSSWIVRSSLSALAVAGALTLVVVTNSFGSRTVAAETEPAASIDDRVGQVLRDASELLNAKEYDQARDRLSILSLPTLSPYERSRAEQMYFNLDVKAENYASARLHMENAIASGGMSSREIETARYQLAQLLMQEEQWAEGAAALEEWLETATDVRGGSYYLLAAAYYNLERYDRAQAAAERAVALGGDKPQEAWLQMLVAVYLNTEQYEKALPWVREQVRLFPEKRIYQEQLQSLQRQLQRQ